MAEKLPIPKSEADDSSDSSDSSDTDDSPPPINEFDRRYREMIKGWKKCKFEPLLRPIGSCYMSDWSDEKLREIAKTKKFPEEVFDQKNWKSIIVQFFNFYFSGEAPCPIESTIFSAISLLNVSVIDDEITYKRFFEATEYMASGDTKPFFSLQDFVKNATSMDNFGVGSIFVSRNNN